MTLGETGNNANTISTNSHDELVKEKINNIKNSKIGLKVCPSCDNCKQCKMFLKHKQQYHAAREFYEKDKKLTAIDKSTVFLSCDMQKVILLPRFDAYKVCLFTKRLICFKETFAPIDKICSKTLKPIGVLWHEAQMGRNDEDMASSFVKAFQASQLRDFKHIVLWLDNFSGQNKNWTLFTTLTYFGNSIIGPVTIT